MTQGTSYGALTCTLWFPCVPTDLNNPSFKCQPAENTISSMPHTATAPSASKKQCVRAAGIVAKSKRCVKW